MTCFVVYFPGIITAIKTKRYWEESMYFKSTVNQNHISYQATAAVRSICSPLIEQTPVEFFYYGRNYHDGGALRLHTNGDYFSTWLQNDHAWSPTYLDEGWYLWNETDPNDQIQIREQQFHYGNGLTIIRSHDRYSEIFGFAPGAEQSMMNLMLNQREVFDRFSHYFNEAAGKIIDKAEQSLIYIPNKKIVPVQRSLKEEFDPQQLLDALPVKSVDVPGMGKISLSKRELICFKGLLMGQTAKLMSESLGLSQKTVETYIIRLKKKFNCSTKSELINLAWQLGIIKTTGTLISH